MGVEAEAQEAAHRRKPQIGGELEGVRLGSAARRRVKRRGPERVPERHSLARYSRPRMRTGKASKEPTLPPHPHPAHCDQNTRGRIVGGNREMKEAHRAWDRHFGPVAEGFHQRHQVDHAQRDGVAAQRARRSAQCARAGRDGLEQGRGGGSPDVPVRAGNDVLPDQRHEEGGYLDREHDGEAPLEDALASRCAHLAEQRTERRHLAHRVVLLDAPARRRERDQSGQTADPEASANEGSATGTSGSIPAYPGPKACLSS